MKRSIHKITKSLLIVLITFFIGSGDYGASQKAKKKSVFLTVHIIDVGQGDAIYIDLFGRKKVLIDCGPPSRFYKYYYSQKKKRGVRYFVKKFNIKTLDQFIISHPQIDHIGGLSILLKKIKVKEVLDPGYAYPSRYYESILKLIEKKKIKYRIVRRGLKYQLEGVQFEILSPAKLITYTRSNVNANSIVLKVVYKDISFLFTGDIEQETEAMLLSLKDKLKSTFLKAPHHGSETSSTLDFLRLVQPRSVFISCGANNIFGHPSPTTLKRYAKLNIPVYRTDIHGTISIQTNGYTYKIRRESG
ncbi:MAG TPA: MBL fold metallo-hydrolase [Spirochaetes bacterium]|mgnify:CR=1 FL=1|nr:MBL fold metallo-hydrolase [Spirochaetota bacterium]